jgi:hypothetical protein
MSWAIFFVWEPEVSIASRGNWRGDWEGERLLYGIREGCLGWLDVAGGRVL